MTNPFSNFDWSLKSIGRVLGVAIAGVIGLSLVAMIISFAIRTVASPFMGGGGYPEMGYDQAMVTESFYAKDGAMVGRAFSNNILPIPPEPNGEFVDADAEDYEIQNYTAGFEVGDKEEICGKVAGLKSDKEIVFERSNEGDDSCNYTFKVIKERTAEIIKFLEGLDPEYLDANTYTIQKTVVGLTDQLSIFQEKLNQIEAALAEAQGSYDELTKLATRKNDIESLTKLIELKLNTIERLSREQVSVNQQIEAVERDRAEQLERLKYTNFNVNVYEDKLIDWEQIGDNWRWELRKFIDDVNEAVQWVSVKLVSFILYALSSLLYLAVAFGFLKLVWILGKKVWKMRIGKN